MILFNAKLISESFDVPKPAGDKTGGKLWELLKKLPHDSGRASIVWNLYKKDKPALGADELEKLYVAQFSTLMDNFDQYDSYAKELLSKNIDSVKVNGAKFALRSNAGLLSTLRSAKGITKLVDAMYRELQNQGDDSSDFDPAFKMESKDLQNIRILGYSQNLVCFATKTLDSTNKFIYGLWRNSNMNTPYGNGEDDSACKVNSPFCTRMQKHWGTYSKNNPDYQQFWFFLKPDAECSAVGPLSDKGCAEVYRKMQRRGYELLVGLDDSRGNANDRYDEEIRGKIYGSEYDENFDKYFKMFDKSGKDMTPEVKSFYGRCIFLNKYLNFPIVCADTFTTEEIVDHAITPEALKLGEQVRKCQLKDCVVPAGVKSIARYAFNRDADMLESVTLPDTVERIGNCAFTGCKYLKRINIPNSVKTIGDSVFKGCEGLAEIYIPDSVETIGYEAFMDCSKLEKVRLPAGLTELDAEFFQNDGALKSVRLPPSLKKICAQAFCETGITAIDIPPSVTRICTHAFYNSGLERIDLPDTVEALDTGAFRSCVNLTHVKLPRFLVSIPAKTFSGCHSLQEVRMPESLDTIGYNAFEHCYSLRTIKIPNGVGSIGMEAFLGCTNLERLEIPASVKYVYDGALNGCGNLQEVVVHSEDMMETVIKLLEYRQRDIVKLVPAATESKAMEWAEYYQTFLA